MFDLLKKVIIKYGEPFLVGKGFLLDVGRFTIFLRENHSLRKESIIVTNGRGKTVYKWTRKD